MHSCSFVLGCDEFSGFMSIKAVIFIAAAISCGGLSGAAIAVEQQSPIIELVRMRIDGDVASRVDIDAIVQQVTQQITDKPEMIDNPFSGLATAVADRAVRSLAAKVISQVENGMTSGKVPVIYRMEREGKKVVVWISAPHETTEPMEKIGIEMTRKKNGWKVVGMRI
jgi:hypothetical protein